MYQFFSRLLPTSKLASSTTLDLEIYYPSKRHKQTIILLHGRDSTAVEFSEQFFESQTNDGGIVKDIFPNLKWVFPSAPLIPSPRFEMELSQWFDMYSTDNPHERESEQDLTQSINAILHVLDKEVKIVGANNVFLGGISQGSAVAIHVLLNQQQRLGGFIGFSSWLPRPTAIENVGHDLAERLKTPVFLAHCEDDQTINIKYGRELRDRLREAAMQVEWHEYPNGGHWINEPDEMHQVGGVPSGVDHLVQFLESTINGKTV